MIDAHTYSVTFPSHRTAVTSSLVSVAHKRAVVEVVSTSLEEVVVDSLVVVVVVALDVVGAGLAADSMHPLLKAVLALQSTVHLLVLVGLVDVAVDLAEVVDSLAVEVEDSPGVVAARGPPQVAALGVVVAVVSMQPPLLGVLVEVA